MKKILITGANSYIGISFKKWIKKWSKDYSVDSISVRGYEWKDKNFSKYDVVLHVAGIAHIKETKENEHLYYKVNRDLVYQVAKKARNDGVKQFIFISSMSIYGMETGVINRNTIPCPQSNYGKSKFQAEKLIITLEKSNFKIAILRPPMVYGKGCRGNYPRLAKLALQIPFFPDVKNRRSMIYIDNLCEFIRYLIDNYSKGLFLPQNKEYICTSDMVKLIAEVHGKKIRMIKLFNPLLKLLKVSTINKVFGNLTYEKEMLLHNNEYIDFKFSTTIKLTEK